MASRLRRSRWAENHEPRHPQAAELARLTAHRRIAAPFSAEERALQARLDEERADPAFCRRLPAFVESGAAAR